MCHENLHCSKVGLISLKGVPKGRGLRLSHLTTFQKIFGWKVLNYQ